MNIQFHDFGIIRKVNDTVFYNNVTHWTANKYENKCIISYKIIINFSEYWYHRRETKDKFENQTILMNIYQH